MPPFGALGLTWAKCRSLRDVVAPRTGRGRGAVLSLAFSLVFLGRSRRGEAADGGSGRGRNGKGAGTNDGATGQLQWRLQGCGAGSATIFSRIMTLLHMLATRSNAAAPSLSRAAAAIRMGCTKPGFRPGLRVYWTFGPEDGASAAFGKGDGLSGFGEVRDDVGRSLPRGRPAKLIEVPGIEPRGLMRKALSSSMVHLPALAFIAAE